MISDKSQPSLLSHLIIISGVFAVIGFIPYERLLSIEFKSIYFSMLTSWHLALISLITFLSLMMIYVLRLGKWYSSLAMLIFPLLIIATSFFLFLSTLVNDAKWHDLAIYKNHNRYLIMQEIAYGREEMDRHYRLIETSSVNDAIRCIQIRDSEVKNVDIFDGAELLLYGLKWCRQHSD